MKRFPNPLVLLFIGVILAGLLTRVLPAGEFQRQEDPATGREAVVHGSYHSHPVVPFETMIALPRGMMEAGEVIFLVFFAGGAFTVIDKTGALRAGFGRLIQVLGRHELLVIPIACYAFGAAGALARSMREACGLAAHGIEYCDAQA
jgi:uncharacterized ion transporter superfamily protein YfcC